MPQIEANHSPSSGEGSQIKSLSSPSSEVNRALSEKPRQVHWKNVDTSEHWSDMCLLGYTPMDDMHREFYDLVGLLLNCDERSVHGAIVAFEAHLRSHFEQEDKWMIESNFPPRDCHIDEHAAVLKSMTEIREALHAGRVGVASVKDFAQHVLRWFPGHADYLDSALAAWMCKRSYGGTPVVMRRSTR